MTTLQTARVQLETHNKTSQATLWFIVPEGSSLIYEDIEIFNSSNGISLIKNTDYIPIDLCSIPTQLLGKGVYSAICIINADITQCSISYTKIIGYEKSIDYNNSLQNMLSELAQRNSSIDWRAVGNKPGGYDPLPHRHHIETVVGFDTLVHTLDGLAKIILLGDDLDHARLKDDIDNLIIRRLAETKEAFQELADDYSQSTTKLQSNINSAQTRVELALSSLTWMLNNLTLMSDYATTRGMADNQTWQRQYISEYSALDAVAY